MASELIPQPESRTYACALNAFAVASGIDSRRIEAVLGHDGTRMLGFTDAELVRVMWLLKIPATTIIFEDLDITGRVIWRNVCVSSGLPYVLYYNIGGPQDDEKLHAVAGLRTKLCDVREKVREITDIGVSTIHTIYVLTNTKE